MLYTSQPLTVGPPIALTFRTAIQGSSAPVSISQIANLGPEYSDRTLVILGWNVTHTVYSVQFCGQAIPLRLSAFSQANLYVASAIIPKNVGGPLVVMQGGNTNSRLVAYTITGLTSPVPVDAQTNSTVADTVRTIDLNTKVGGVAVALSVNNVTSAQSCTWTGDQTPTENADTNLVFMTSCASITNTNDDTANTITATWAAASTSVCNIIGASFR